MDQRMFINAVHPEECRIAIVDDGSLAELEIESNVGKKAKGNVYRGRISRIEPSLQAAFIDIGTQRNGFLQINDVHPACFRTNPPRSGKVRIQDVLEPGQELVVQVVKEERDMKGATLTTYLSLPGRYVVIMPGSDRGGISRKISDGDQRVRLRKLARELEMPAGIGMIIRTAGLDRSLSELSRDLSLQLKLWESILVANQSANAPALLYKDNDLTTRVIRDYFTPEIREITIDDPETFRKVKEFVGQVMPRYRSRVKLYEGKEPIFTAHGIDQQVQDTLMREVKLHSGGSIIIEQLEALVAIDVNSGKATDGENIEETAYKTNLEAAEEVARQLRLRDLGGLIVIDFIDMVDKRHRANVERKLQDALRVDKARIELGRVSKFGLLEMSRQRLRASLASHSHISCDHCRGNGVIKNPELVALEALRKIQAAVVVGHVAKVRARLASMPAFFLLNNKRSDISALEATHGVQILILPDGRLRPDEYEFEMEGTRDNPPITTVAGTPAPTPQGTPTSSKGSAPASSGSTTTPRSGAGSRGTQAGPSDDSSRKSGRSPQTSGRGRRPSTRSEAAAPKAAANSRQVEEE
jgi:ribonuclease E